ncbi:predicted protein [Streptomyces albidoflavus]|nr:predicted protein [Streptomyces albidoflavus]
MRLGAGLVGPRYPWVSSSAGRAGVGSLAGVVGRPSVVAASVTDVLKRRTGLILPVSGEGDRHARQAQQAAAGTGEPR